MQNFTFVICEQKSMLINVGRGDVVSEAVLVTAIR